MLDETEDTKSRDYRNRAEELRTIAQDFTRPDTQWMLTTLAREYERMAEAIDKGIWTAALEREWHF